MQTHKGIFIIAEAGVNHNGCLETARRLIDAAKRCGADAVKFQTFDAGRMTSRRHKTQLAMLRRLQLPDGAFAKLASYCKGKGISFLSSPFDLESIDLLDGLGLELLKIPSGEITNLPYLRRIGALKKRLIVSTGASGIEEIRSALRTLVKNGTPKKNITLLHCTSAYPAPVESANLRAMLTIRDTFGVEVGYSDHTPGIEVALAAAALGASVIEKHFTLDRNMPGPDHRTSLGPKGFQAMAAGIRTIEKALGDGIKQPAAAEKQNRQVIRKSVVAARKIAKGEAFTKKNIAVKRPGTGITPMRWDELLGAAAKKEFKADELIQT